MFDTRFFVVILLFAVAVQVNGDSNGKPETTVRNDIKGRLLTPDEGCGRSAVPNINRIVGGTAAKKGAWPWTALLGRQNDSFVSFHCGGSLITSRHVLSAGHCFKIEFNFVRLGEHDTYAFEDDQIVDIDIDSVKIHEQYVKVPKINDIAIVYLAHDVEFTDRIRPICIPTSQTMQSRNFIGTNPFVAGWGRVSETSARADILQQVQVPVITNDECAKKYEKADRYQFGAEYRFNETYVICAGFTAGGKDSCYGDSGGPLMLPIHESGRFPFYQIGIISYGYGCGRPNIPGVYTNVKQYADWIIGKLH